MKINLPHGSHFPFESNGVEMPQWMIERYVVVNRMIDVWTDRLEVAKFNDVDVELTRTILAEYLVEKAKIISFQNGDI